MTETPFVQAMFGVPAMWEARAPKRRPAEPREGTDDHFYGAWKGGKASAGGHPAGASRAAEVAPAGKGPEVVKVEPGPLTREKADDLYRAMGYDPDGPQIDSVGGKVMHVTGKDGFPETVTVKSLMGSGVNIETIPKDDLMPGGLGYVTSRKPTPHVYRAVSEEDWQGMQRRGFMQSDGRMNLSADEGTVTSLEPSTFYLPGRLASSPVGDHPGRILRIRLDREDGWKVDPRDGYVKTSSRIPVSRVDMVSPVIVTRVRPVAGHDYNDYTTEVREGTDDHFYGAWKGGKASAGGHPAGKGASEAHPVYGAGGENLGTEAGRRAAVTAALRPPVVLRSWEQAQKDVDDAFKAETRARHEANAAAQKDWIRDKPLDGSKAQGAADALKRAEKQRGAIPWNPKDDEWVRNAESNLEWNTGRRYGPANGLEVLQSPAPAYGKGAVGPFAGKSTVAFMYGAQGEPVARLEIRMARVDKDDPTSAWHPVIETVSIRPSLKGQGLGKAFYDRIQDHTTIDLYQLIGESRSFTKPGKAFAVSWLEHRVALEDRRHAQGLIVHEAASDDHFYGAWSGGKKASGGHPAAASGGAAGPGKALRDGRADYGMQHSVSADYGARGDDLSTLVPADIYTHPEWYGGEEWTEAVRQVRAMRGKPDAPATIYRAVPVGVDVINPGDWITLDRRYAEQHGISNLGAVGGPNGRAEGREGKDFRVLKQTVRAKDIVWPGDYLPEWGYHPVTDTREASGDDHFYGAWVGGKASSGGHPAGSGGVAEEKPKYGVMASDRAASARDAAQAQGSPSGWESATTDEAFDWTIEQHTASDGVVSHPSDLVMTHREAWDTSMSRVHVYRETPGGPVAGYVHVMKDPWTEEHPLEIGSVQVRPSLRGTGVGMRMYDHIQDEGIEDLYAIVGKSKSFTPAGKAFAVRWLEHRVQVEQERERLAGVREAGDDHFYGAWKGGRASQGGGPADRWASTDELVADMEKRWPGTKWGDMRKVDPHAAAAIADQMDGLMTRFGPPPNFQGAYAPAKWKSGVLAEVAHIKPGDPGSYVILPQSYLGTADRVRAAAENTWASGAWSVGGATKGSVGDWARDLVTHEMGHEYMGLNLHLRIGADRHAPVRKELEPWFHQDFLPRFQKAHVSKYARKNPHEAWAELFAGAVGPTSGTNTNHDVLAVKAILDKHYPPSKVHESEPVWVAGELGPRRVTRDHADLLEDLLGDDLLRGLRLRVFLVEAGSGDDHFYGAWKGKGVADGGAPYGDKPAVDPDHPLTLDKEGAVSVGNGWKVLGTTDEQDTCDNCGKTGLKRTVALDSPDGEIVYFGTDCASQRVRVRPEKITAAAEKADLGQKALAREKRIKAARDAYMADPIQAMNLKRFESGDPHLSIWLGENHPAIREDVGSITLLLQRAGGPLKVWKEYRDAGMPRYDLEQWERHRKAVVSVRNAVQEADLEEADDDHFYGAWGGGSKGQGGGPVAAGGPRFDSGGKILPEQEALLNERLGVLHGRYPVWKDMKVEVATPADVESMKGTGSPARYTGGDIKVVTKDFVTPESVATFKQMEKGLGGGVGYLADATIEGMVTHEYGHAIQHYLGVPKLLTPSRKRAFDTWWKEAQAAYARPGRQLLSGRSMDSPKELFAEMFAHAMSGKGDPYGMLKALDRVYAPVKAREASSDDHYYGAWVGGKKSVGGGPLFRVAEHPDGYDGVPDGRSFGSVAEAHTWARGRFDGPDSWGPGQADAAWTYTSSPQGAGYKAINGWARNGGEKPPEVDALDRLLERSTVPETIVARRRVTPEALGGTDMLARLPGAVLRDRGYLSTNLGPGGATGMNWRPVRVNITVPKGTHGAYLGWERTTKPRYLRKEAELLLPRDTPIQVVRVTQRGHRWDVDAVVVREAPDEG